MDQLHPDNNGFMPHIPQPALMNPPPQIFGGYTNDGLPMTANLPDLTGPLFHDGALLEDSNEAKRRRIARVCHVFFNDGVDLESRSWDKYKGGKTWADSIIGL